MEASTTIRRDDAVAAWEALFRAQVTVMRALSAEFPSREISLTEYDVLFNVSRQPDRRLRLRDLTRHVLLTQPSVSRLVDRLVTQGLLCKERDPSDARGAVICMTDAGYRLYRKVATQHAASIARIVGGALDAGELERLTELCVKLRAGV